MDLLNSKLPSDERNICLELAPVGLGYAFRLDNNCLWFVI